MISKARTVLAEAANVSPLANLYRPNMFSRSAIEKEQSFAPREHSHHLLYRNSTVNSEVDVDNWMWNRPKQLNATFWFVTHIYLNHTDFTALDNTLYTI